MRKLYILLFTLFIGLITNAQLSGTKNIPGDYATIREAVIDLNVQGVGAGGVIFNVVAGHTESSPDSTYLTATGTASDLIVFQKSGAGANPVVTRTGAGVLATSTFGGSGDAVIIIHGSDYVTFNGIDVSAADQGIEYGYFLRRASATDGCKSVSIRNAGITLTKGTSQYVIGIYSSNLTIGSSVSSATGLTLTSTGGRTENLDLRGNTISNVHVGISVRGYAASTPYDLYDQSPVIGVSGGGNTIQNIAGGSTSTAYGVYLIYQNAVNVNHNTINNMAGGGTGATGILYGVFMSTANTSNFTATNNDVNLTTSSTSSSLYGVYNNAASGAINMSNNIVALNTTATTSGIFGYIYNGNSGTSIDLNNNSITGTTIATTGSTYFIYNNNTYSGTANIQDNSTTGSLNRTGTSGACYGYYNNGSPTGIDNVSGNNFSNVTVTGTSTFTGILSTTAAGHTQNNFNNIISNITGGTGTLVGINLTTGTIRNVYNNAIHSFTGGGTVTGIITGSGFTSGGIYNNKIYNLTSTSTATTAGLVAGISVTGGTTVRIFNNLIGDLNLPSSGSTDGIRGISITSTTASTTIGIYFNTIYLNETSGGTLFGSSGVFHTTSATATTAALDMRNNIIVNISTPIGAAVTAAYRRSSTTLTNYSSASNNNAFYAGTTSATNLIFYDGTNSDQTLAAFKTRVSPRETNSVTENPPFISTNGANAGFLHINAAIATQLESGGVPIAGITDDYDGDTRNAGTPDLGADEGNFILAGDQTPPTITYTPLAGTCATSDRTITATIVDAVGIPAAGGLIPRIYFRKNSGAYVSAAGNLTSGSGTNGTWDFVISAAALGGLSNNDIVSYYVVAQDNSANIASNPNGVLATDVNNVTTHPPSPDFFAVGIASGTFTVGSGGNFATLTHAVAAYNAGCISGPIVFSLTDATYPSEIFPIVINSIAGSSSTNTLTINPASGVAATISGNTGATPLSLIRLNGADYVIIDGLNTGGSTLTIENTSTSAGSGVIWLSSNGAGAGATNNSIKNTNIKAGVSQNTAATVTYGIVIGGSTFATTVGSITAGDDNDNNTIQGNTFTKVRYAFFSRGGSSTNLNTGTVVTGNTFGATAFGADVVGKSGVLVREEDGIQVTNNTFRFIGGDYANTSAGTDRAAIAFGTDVTWSSTTAPTSVVVKNAVITGNRIHDIVEERTFSAAGIIIASADGTNPTNNLVANNTIANVKANGTSGDQSVGIALSASHTDRIVFNSISMTGDTDPNASATTPTVSANGINISTTNVVNPMVVNNIVFMDLTSSSAPALKNATINIPTAYAWGTGSLNYNDLAINIGNTQSNIGSVGSTAGTFYATLNAWKTASSQDAASISVVPVFTSATDLHLVPASNAPIDNQGTPVTGITVDIDGDTRNATTPDVGADEFTAPVITDIGVTAVVVGSPLCAGSNQVSATIQNFGSTTITSVSIDWSATPGGPQVQANPTINLAPGDFVTVPLGNFTFAGGTTYSITATTSNPNGGADGNAANDALTRNNITTDLSGTYTVGVGMNYPTLTAAIAAYNTRALCGPVVFSLTDVTYASETFPIIINANASANATNTLTIQPAAGVGVTISGTGTPALIDLNGADYVTINGVNTAGSSLLLRNTSTSAAAIRLINDASNNTVQNATVEGAVTTSSLGVVVLSTAVATGNDNNTITNNTIRDRSDAAGVPGNLVYSNGTNASPNTGNTLSNNTLKNFTGTAVLITGTGTSNGNENWTVQNNEIFQEAARTTANTGISFSSLGTNTISQNHIHDLNTSSTVIGINVIDARSTIVSRNRVLQYTVAGGTSSWTGILFGGTSGTLAGVTLVNNKVLLVPTASTSMTIYGLRDDAFTGNSLNVYYNTVVLGGTATGSNTWAFQRSTTTPTDVVLRNNIFFNNRSGGTLNHFAAGDQSMGTGTFSSNYNIFVGTGATAANFMDRGTASAGTPMSFSAWQATAGTPDLNSLASNPGAANYTVAGMFVSATDLHSAGTSPASNIGTVIAGITTDFDNETRNATTPDVGADEFSGGGLPAQLLTFSGHRAGNANNLKWTIAQEIDVLAYDVERSYNGRTWERVGSVASLGNTSSQRSYTFSDNNFAGLKQQYRLRIIDMSAVQKLSNIVVISGTRANVLTLNGLFPNPAISKVNLVVDAPVKDNIVIVVTDAAGRIVKAQKTSVEAGSNTLPLNVTGLSQGSYVVRITGETSMETAVSKFVKE